MAKVVNLKGEPYEQCKYPVNGAKVVAVLREASRYVRASRADIESVLVLIRHRDGSVVRCVTPGASCAEDYIMMDRYKETLL